MKDVSAKHQHGRSLRKKVIGLTVFVTMSFIYEELGIDPQPDKDSSKAETNYQGRVNRRRLISGIDEIRDYSGGWWSCWCIIKTGCGYRLRSLGHYCHSRVDESWSEKHRQGFAVIEYCKRFTFHAPLKNLPTDPGIRTKALRVHTKLVQIRPHTMKHVDSLTSAVGLQVWLHSCGPQGESGDT